MSETEEDRIARICREQIAPHYTRLIREHRAMQGHTFPGPKLEVLVPASFHEGFDGGTIFHGMPTRRSSEVERPEVRYRYDSPHTRLACVVPVNKGDHFTPEAVAHLVGQTPRWLPGLDWSRGGPKATVVAAKIEDGELHITLDVDDRALPAELREPIPCGIGYARLHEEEGVVKRFSLLAIGETGAPSPVLP